MVRRVGSSAATPRTNRLFIPAGFAMSLSYPSKGISETDLTTGQGDQGVGKKLTLGFEHSSRQNLGGVIYAYGYLCLGQYGAFVVIFSHQMDGAATDGFICCNNRFVHT